MCFVTLSLSVDPSLGRVDYSSFSDQTLMETFIDGFDEENRNRCQDKDGLFLDVCEWFCIDCNADKRVTKIYVHYHLLNGTLQLPFVPPKVIAVELAWKKLTGSADLTRLPQVMRTLHLHNNELSGSIDLSQLPDSMRHLHLSGNSFSGSIDLTHLPEGMMELSLDRNQFSGSFIAKNLPPSRFCVISARKNQFNDIAVVESQTLAEILLSDSGISSVVEENGISVPFALLLEQKKLGGGYGVN